MLYPSINDLSEKVDSKYSLVIVAAKRARELIDGKAKLLESEIDKPVSIAADEIINGLIRFEREDKYDVGV